jgi:tetratricopeptide (TPR) repeat protein
MGHETEADRFRKFQLEAAITKGAATPRDTLELALLYIEPLHLEDQAAKILQQLFKDPEYGSMAAIWYSYVALQALMTHESLNKAAHVLRPLRHTNDDRIQAAAAFLLAQIEAELTDWNAESVLQLLESSVARAPTWVFNRQLLALLLRRRMRFEEAANHLKAALQNILPEQFRPHDVIESSFEESITGRASHKIGEVLRSELQDVERSMADNADHPL